MKIYEKKGEYKTRQIAETKANSYGNKDNKIILMPEKSDLKVGFEIYLSDGSEYGKIVEITESFYYIRRSFKDEGDRTFFLKDSFMEKYENGVFIMKEELDE